MADVSILVNIALQVALRLIIAALTPKQINEGPRLDDTALTTSTYGEEIPLGYGTTIMAGNIIWGKDIEEVIVVTDISKGNPFSLGKNITYYYYGTFAISISRRQIDRILRIYADGKIIYDETRNETIDRTAVMDDLDFNLYYGTPDQKRDPIIEADVGTDQCPAYRGIAYIVFNRLPLENFGNRIPQLRFVVAFATSTKSRKSYNFDGIQLNTFNSADYDPSRNILYTRAIANDGSGDIWLTAHDAYSGEVIFRRKKEDLGWIYDGLNNTNILRAGGPDCPYLLMESSGGNSGMYGLIDKESLSLIGVTLRSTVTGVCDGVFKSNTWAPVAQSDVDPLCGKDEGAPFIDGQQNFEIIRGEQLSDSDFAADFGIKVGYGQDPNFYGVFLGYSGEGGGRGTVGVTKLTPNGHTFMWGSGQIGSAADLDVTNCAVGASIVQGPTLKGKRFVFVVVTTGDDILANNKGPWYLLALQLKGADEPAPQDQGQATGGEDQDYFKYNPDTGTNIGFNGVHGDIVAMIPEQAASGAGSGNHHLWYDETLDILVWSAEGLDGAGSGSGSFGGILGNDPGVATRAFKLNSTTIGYGESAPPETTFSADLIWTLDEIIAPPFGSSAHHDYSKGFIYATDTGDRIVKTYDIETGELIDDLSSGRLDYPEGDGIDWLSVSNGEFYWFDDGRQLDVHKGIFYYYPPFERWPERLSTIVEDIVARSKLTTSDIDVTALEDTWVQGYPVARSLSYRAAIEPLMNAYNFYGVEKEGILTFDFHDNVPTVTIPEEDLVRSGNDNVFEESRGQELETPRALYVQHLDPAQDDNKMVQGARRTSFPATTMNSVGEQTVELPLYLTAEEGAKVAERILYDTWVQREAMRFRLPYRYLNILPNDVLQVTAEGRTEAIRATRVSIGANLQMEIEGPVVDSTIYTQRVQGIAPPGSPNYTVGGSAALYSKFVTGWLMDMPLLRDGDLSGRSQGLVYYAGSQGATAGGGTYPGATIRTSVDGAAYEVSGGSVVEAPWGIIRSQVPDIPSVDWNGIQDDPDDYIDVNVVSQPGKFVTVTEAQMLANANSAAIIRPRTGEIELIGFQNVEDLGDGIYRLSKFIRGKRGTNTFALGYGAPGGTLTGQNPNPVLYLVLLDEAWVTGWNEALTSDEANMAYQIIPSHNAQFVARSGSQTFKHRSLAPYEPSHIKLVEESSEFEIQWTRRTRQGGGLVNEAVTGEVPLFEDEEQYSIEICNIGHNEIFNTHLNRTAIDGTKFNIVRTLTAVTPAVEYTRAQMTEDGYNVFNVERGTNPIYMRVRQVSAQVGAGMSDLRTVYLEGT